MPKGSDQQQVKAFIEDMARKLEATGAPWIAGAIVGFLCITPASDASQAELADQLGTSVAAISAMVRRLCREGTLERVVVPGQRAARYRLVPGSYLARLDAAAQSARELVQLAEWGLALQGAAITPGKSYLREFRDINKALGGKINELRDEQGRRAHQVRGR
jgi:DNA-binding transcriptional regulator GbsR (MarR family)